MFTIELFSFILKRLRTITILDFFKAFIFVFALQPEKCWEADLEEMASLIDDRTRMIVVINPSNPCGSVYTKEHLEAILDGRYDDDDKDGVMIMMVLW